MCGISGIFNPSVSENNLKEKIRNMGASLFHRGPDKWGEYINKSIALGHNRLTILDSEGGKQPMTIDGVTIIFNGEIYNNFELRRSLIKEEIFFNSSHSDTESILRGYLKYGIEVFQKLDGMFAFAIYDSRINKLLICRDYIGIKTLYYHPIDNGIVFASEVKAIIASSFYKPCINKFQLPNFFFNRSVYGGETMFLNVFKLLPGHFIEYDLEKFCFKINSFTPKYLKEDLKKEKLENLLSKVIRSHLQADCDVSLALSGGIDSSIIAYFASLDKRKISTFNIKTLSEFDESIYAESISKLIKSKHFSVLLNSESMIKYFDKWALYNDDPIGDPSALAVFLLCQEVNKNGFKVLLSGEGADELFVGYNSYIRYFVFRFLCLLPYSNKIIKILSNLIKDSRLKDHLFLKDALNFPYFLGTSHNISIENLSKLFCDSKKSLTTIFNFIKKSYNDPKNLFSALYYDQEFRLSNDLLVRADKASMAHSVEIRVPFLSLKLLNYSRNIIFSKFISFLPMLNKIMLKKISYKLFGFFFTFRPKNGFDLPVDRWIYFLTKKSAKIYFKDSYFKDTLNYDFLKNSLNISTRNKKNISLIWHWLIIEKWYREWILDSSKSLQKIYDKVPKDYFKI